MVIATSSNEANSRNSLLLSIPKKNDHKIAQVPKNENGDERCTLAYIRVLTRPFLFPPEPDELGRAFLDEWNVLLPVDSSDDASRIHWQEQKHTDLFRKMLTWEQNKTAAVLHPYFSFGASKGASAFFFRPWHDFANCLKFLLLHQIGSRDTSTSTTLTSHDTDVFVATAPNVSIDEIKNLRISRSYYLLRCHYETTNGQKNLVFGYHIGGPASSTFHRLHVLSLGDDNWRLTACIILKNMARIIHVLKDYAVPLTCTKSRSLVKDTTAILGKRNLLTGPCVQKIYHSNQIWGIPGISVTNMIRIYEAIVDVPHTDRLVSVVKSNDTNGNNSKSPSFTCRFAPVGRSYLPENVSELLDALVCVAEALVHLHAKGLMHRDIRWSNVFHALQSSDTTFSREWVLFDFEFAAVSPQPAFGAHTLTPGNHAPEMILLEEEDSSEPPPPPHTTAVDIWGLGYLVEHCQVDLPRSHFADLRRLQEQCLQDNPLDRPTALECLQLLQQVQERRPSSEKDVTEF